MTSEDKAFLLDLSKRITSLADSNQKFKEEIATTLTVLNEKIEKKNLPITLEQNISNIIQSSLGKAINDALTGYDSPLKKLVAQVVDSYSDQIKKIVSESVEIVITADQFKQSIVEGFSHKIARTIISNNDSIFDKVSNELKQDSTFRAKLTLAVAQVVNETLNKGDSAE